MPDNEKAVGYVVAEVSGSDHGCRTYLPLCIIESHIHLLLSLVLFYFDVHEAFAYMCAFALHCSCCSQYLEESAESAEAERWMVVKLYVGAENQTVVFCKSMGYS